MTRSVPPYSLGGTASASGAIWAMRKRFLRTFAADLASVVERPNEVPLPAFRAKRGLVPATRAASRLHMILPPPPIALLDGASLFLDLDGTLIEFAARPDAVEVGEELRDLLVGLSVRLDGRIAVISGRSLDDLSAQLRIDALALAGSHGLETRSAEGVVHSCEESPGLDLAIAELTDFAAENDLLIEPKPGSVALHFRLRPEIAEAAETFACATATRYGLMVQRGAMVVELRLPGADKGTIVRQFMAEPPFMSGSPVFVGDDLTDEHAFEAAIELGGAAVLVGDERATAANYRLSSVDAVRAWLGSAHE